MDKNTKTISVIFIVVFAMIGLAFASVPLYRIFCQMTGFGGTTMLATSLPDRTVDRDVTVRFNTNTSPDIDWSFKPEKPEETIKLGQQGLIAFKARNNGAKPSTGTAVYNVTPAKVGQYFSKIQCFCFGEQTLAAGQEMDMPVVFFIDPKFNEDPEMDDVSTITLSYTFFRTESEELDKAMEAFYNAETK